MKEEERDADQGWRGWPWAGGWQPHPMRQKEEKCACRGNCPVFFIFSLKQELRLSKNEYGEGEAGN